MTNSRPPKPPKSGSKAAKPRAAGHGGRRLGAGRKTAQAKKAKADLRESLTERITARSGEILDSLFTLALGVKIKDVDDKTGEVEYFVCPPDRQACEYLLNQAIGKPTERKEIGGPEGGPIPVSVQGAIDKIYGGEGDL
jgi:hypothetical protein